MHPVKRRPTCMYNLTQLTVHFPSATGGSRYANGRRRELATSQPWVEFYSWFVKALSTCSTIDRSHPVVFCDNIVI